MDFKKILDQAFEAGKNAMVACKPNPVGFYSAGLDDKPLGPMSIESEGNCGGAYITGLKGTSEIVRFFKKNGTVRSHNFDLPDGTYISKGVYKGYTLHPPAHKVYNGQSHERKTAFCEAYVNILKANGIPCHVHDYLT